MTKFIALILLLVSLKSPAIANNEAASNEVERLLQHWINAHNSRDISQLSKIYDDKVRMNNETAARDQTLLSKKLLFVRNPGYHLRISSPVNLCANQYVAYCYFTITETLNKGKQVRDIKLVFNSDGANYAVSEESTSINDSENPECERLILAAGPSMSIPMQDHAKQPHLIFLIVGIVAAGSVVLISKTKNLILPEVLHREDFSLLSLYSAPITEGVSSVEIDESEEPTDEIHQSEFGMYVHRLIDAWQFKISDSPAKLEITIDDLKTNSSGLTLCPRSNSGISFRIFYRFIPDRTSLMTLKIENDDQSPAVKSYLFVGIDGDAEQPREQFLIELRQGVQHFTIEEIECFRKFGLIRAHSIKDALI